MRYPIVNVSDSSDKSKRIVGFKIGETDKAYGAMGLSEPCFWLEDMANKADKYDDLLQENAKLKKLLAINSIEFTGVL